MANAHLVQQIAQLGWGGFTKADFDWSSNGSFLAIVHRGGIWLYHSGEFDTPYAKLASSSLTVTQIVFSPDSRWLAIAEDNVVRVRDVRAGTEKVALKGHQDKILSLAFSLDSNLLASASKDQTVRLWHLNDALASVVIKEFGSKGYELSDEPDKRPDLIFSPNGKWLVFSADEGETYSKVRSGRFGFAYLPNKLLSGGTGVSRRISASRINSLRAKLL
ncbi:MAG: hypothetical protein ABI947_04540 [Chloroflexota bacterium]